LNNFPHPLNTWIDEEVEVPVMTPKVNEKESRVEFTQEMKKVAQKTMYVDSKQTRIVCGSHTYACIDKGSYLFKCKKCDWHKIAFPVTFKFDQETGILTYRHTGIRS